jgi:hypothetical protein
VGEGEKGSVFAQPVLEQYTLTFPKLCIAAPIPECQFAQYLNKDSYCGPVPTALLELPILSGNRSATPTRMQLQRSGLAARQQMHTSMAVVRMPRTARPSFSLQQAASPIPSAAQQHSLLCRVAAEKDSSRGTNNFNSIDFETLLPSDVEECPHGALGLLLRAAAVCLQPTSASDHHHLLPCPTMCPAYCTCRKR